ncbi:MAG TPA: molybdenum cofactor guanylyltransferase [Bryobacteraceae bacterium]|nr:molybdenum cofactor guanylyltransferase [Bryobacteraceae bacterium]
MSSRAGYVLVGGLSSRMGRDKALLPYRGRTLVESVVQAVTLAAGSATLVGNGQQYTDLGYPIIPDLYPGEGPLGGILTALADTAADWNLITACDMPALGSDFLRGLMDAAEQSGGDALIPAGPSGLLEPLCAVYHRRTARGLETAFGQGIRRVAAALARVRAITYPVPEGTPFQNVNTPEDWASHAG